MEPHQDPRDPSVTIHERKTQTLAAVDFQAAAKIAIAFTKFKQRKLISLTVVPSDTIAQTRPVTRHLCGTETSP
ncbi:MAG TPA: hypothetical protein VMV38_01175 [Candidatus Paceibacterota bacterium]|nr:hypothetical protein [Candidatus Paceibacterota bacterium]